MDDNSMKNGAVLAAGPRAFGDGRHPTTAGMLAALEAIDPDDFRPARALDVGAGSGILSFAIVARFGCPVWASDIDRQAIDTLQENVARNWLDGRIHAVQADGLAHPALQANAPYDLIAMNILAEPLLALAAAAEAALAPGGVLLISGLLQWQEPQVRDAYEGLGLELATRLTAQEWVTLCWQKPA